jgi:ubiquinone/menaquinone biosynthesis C-methylase UbiE
MHTGYADDEHYSALRFIDSLSGMLGLNRFLDVGAGTGRGISFLLERGRECYGVEPVAALIQQGEARGIPKGRILQGSGYSLPFHDNSFDAVFECGMLHHVAEPARVVAEMTRVARKAVFLSDSNRFGQGSALARTAKILLYKTGLWRASRFIQTGGKMYTITEGDGLAYSYSVFDSYYQLSEWATRIWAIPTVETKTARSWLHPLATTPHVLLCAVRERDS